MRRALVVPLLLALATTTFARDVPDPVYPLRDDVGLLDGSRADAVRSVCAQLERETSAALWILIIDTTAGEDAREFARRAFERWGGRTNGAMLVFAMRDRRVELFTGVGYEGLFTRSASERLLTGVVVPRMRSGQPREAVFEGAKAVADKIGVHEAERGRARDQLAAELVEDHVDVHAVDPRTSALLAAEPSPSASTPTPTPVRRTSAGLGLSDGTRSRLGRDLVRGVVFIGLLVWAGFLYYVLSRTFSTGELAVSKGGIIALSLLVPAGVAALLFMTAPQQQVQNVDWGLGGGGALAGVIACTMTSHICPRCRKWMSIHSRTLVSATYHSSGTGQRTYHCGSCSYHHVETYTISRKTRSRSSSSSRSSGGRSSFGGGSSRGGGGGASW